MLALAGPALAQPPGGETRVYSGSALNTTLNTPGNVTMTLQFEDDRVSGDVALQGLKGGGHLAGHRRGGLCELHAESGLDLKGRCDEQGFSGAFALGQQQGRFETKLTKTISGGARRYDANATPVRRPFVGPIAVEIAGDYPAGYTPHWDIVDRNARVRFEAAVPGGKYRGTPLVDWDIRLTMIEGAPTLVIPVYMTQPCIATLQPPPQRAAVLNGSPQTFKLVNFRLMPGPGTAIGAPCYHAHAYTRPLDWSGEITLSKANPGGDVLMALTIDSHDQGKFVGHMEAHDVVLRNKMTPMMALADIESKRLAAQQRQAADADRARQAALDEKAEAMMPQIRARAASLKRTIRVVKGYEIVAIIDPNLLAGSPACGSKVTEALPGLRKKFAEAVEHQRIGIAVSDKAEPHNRGAYTAIDYLWAKAVNQEGMQMASHLAVCDINGAQAYLDGYGRNSTEMSNWDASEEREIAAYMNSH